MLKRMRIFLSLLLAAAGASFAGQAYAHVVTVNESEAYDYSGVKGGADGKTDCCDMRHCRPALEWEWLPQEGKWRFRIKVYQWDPNSKTVDVKVPDAEVTHENIPTVSGRPARRAHWCGYLTVTEGTVTAYKTRCAFVPPPNTARQRLRLYYITRK